ncbi:MAG: hypothetical protein J6W84_08745 [Bacteroidales bacterium]|nr:hypothetical protein [Bacteroidales bacterium]
MGRTSVFACISVCAVGSTGAFSMRWFNHRRGGYSSAACPPVKMRCFTSWVTYLRFKAGFYHVAARVRFPCAAQHSVVGCGK